MTTCTRREFLGSVTAAAAVSSSLRAATPRLPIAFSTLGCPKWTWKTILDQASALGYAAVELRGIQGEMDLTRRPEFVGTRLAESLSDLAARELRISDLGSSVNLHHPDGPERIKQLDEGRRFIDLAHRLQVPYVRVFGDKYQKDQPREATIGQVTSGLRELGTQAKGSGVSIIIESHGDFTDSPTLGAVLGSVDMPSVGLLWDAHHTAVAGKESPDVTFRQLGRYVRHTHLKDSRPAGDTVRYVLTGTGTVPVRETVRVLASNGYRGYYCFEWEKAWHPGIEEPEIAFPHYARTVGQYLAEAGVKPTL